MGTPSPKELPGPRLKAEISVGKSQALLRLVAASLPLPLPKSASLVLLGLGMVGVAGLARRARARRDGIGRIT